jgi:hypothetical protein
MFPMLWGMANSYCPACEHLGRLLEWTSREAFVNYYRCDVCAHVWHHAKNEANSPAVDVTFPVLPLPSSHRQPRRQ